MTIAATAHTVDGAAREGRRRNRRSEHREAAGSCGITILVVVAPLADPDHRRAGHVVPSGGPRRHHGLVDGLRAPLPSRRVDARELPRALDAGGFGNAFLNSLAVAIPSTVIPITIAAFAAYAFSWMEFRGRYVMFVLVVGLLVVPLQMALIPILRLYTGGASHRRGPDLPRPRSERHVSRRLAGAHRVRPASGHLPAAELHRLVAIVDHRVGQDRRGRPLHDLLATGVPLSVPALAAFAIFQFLWVWNDLLVAYVFLGGTAREPGPRPSRCPSSSVRAARTGTC